MIRYPSLNVSGPLASVYVWWRSCVSTHPSLNCAYYARSSLFSYFVWIIVSHWDYMRYVGLVPNIHVSATRQIEPDIVFRFRYTQLEEPRTKRALA